MGQDPTNLLGCSGGLASLISVQPESKKTSPLVKSSNNHRAALAFSVRRRVIALFRTSLAMPTSKAVSGASEKSVPHPARRLGAEFGIGLGDFRQVVVENLGLAAQA